MSMIRQRILTPVFAAAALLACSGSAAAPPRSVSGLVLDTQGRPLANAQVRVRADFLYGRAEVTTGKDGRYVIRDLLKATYRVEAFIQREYNGGTVCPSLAMPTAADYNSFDVSAGAVRNFRWQLTGRVGLTSSYHGAEIFMWLEDLPADASRRIEFKLTPTGPLIDGSPGQTIVRQGVGQSLSGDKALLDIPLGTYRLAAVLVGPSGMRTPLLISTADDMTFRSEVPVAWTPDRFCGMGSPSGVSAFFIRVRPAG